MTSTACVAPARPVDRRAARDSARSLADGHPADTPVVDTLRRTERLGLLTALYRHLRLDGPSVALALCLRACRAWTGRVARLLGLGERRDVGELVAERYLRATGHRIVARNWRSPRDPRDEADLLALSPDRTTLLLVEVKRAAGPWDALDRVDVRKRAVLWRLLCDLRTVHADIAQGDQQADGTASHAPDEAHEAPRPSAGWQVPRPVRQALHHAQRLRCDLIGVEGTDRRASVVRHHTDLLSMWLRDPRSLQQHRSRSPP